MVIVCICSHHDHSLWLSTTLQYQTDDYRLSLYTCCNIYAEEHVASIEYPILNKLCTSLAFFFPLPPSDFAMQMQVLPFHVSTRQMGWIRERVNCNFRSCHLCVGLYCNLSKIDPPLKISLHVPLFWLKLLQRVFFRKYAHLVTAVHAVMLNKNHRRSSIVQEEGLTKEGSHQLHKQVHEKKGTARWLHVYRGLD